VLPAGSVAATTEVEVDVDGGPPMGSCRWVRQLPPLKLKKTSMPPPPGVLAADPAAATTEVKEDVDAKR
jgi:hypothetical protein